MKSKAVPLLVMLLTLALLLTAPGSPVAATSAGQQVYVPVYSHIYSGDRERPFNLAVTLSIRNTESKRSIIIEAVDYYDSTGVLLRRYLDKELVLGALAAVRYVVKESDTSGGSGASFLVRWRSEEPVDAPLIESVMIGTQSQQGISFTSRGQVLSE